MITFIRKKKITILLSLTLLVAAWLHLRNLDGVMYLDEDEARPFTLLRSGPFIFMLCRPIYEIFKETLSVASAFYVAGFLGVASIVLLYAIIRSFGKTRELAAATAMWYAIFPLRMNYSRTLYPAVFLEFFFLLAALSLVRGVSRRRSWLISLSGAIASVLFFVHCSAYWMIFGLLAAGAYLFYLGRNDLKAQTAYQVCARYVFGFLLGYFILDILFMRITGGNTYLAQTIEFGKISAFESKQGDGFSFLAEFFPKVIRSPSGAIITFFTLGAFIFTFYQGLVKKIRVLNFFMLMYFCGYAVFMALIIARVTLLRERHFVALVPLFSLSLGFAADYCAKRFPGLVLTAARVAAICLLCLVMIFKSFQITEETFKITEIAKWLKQHNIPSEAILTSWWLINYRGGEGVNFIPGGFMVSPQNQGTAHWYVENPRFLIAWPLIYSAYHNGICRYIITSGLGNRAQMGEGEPLLQAVRPVMSWPHPYAVFRNRPFYSAQKLSIKLYDLEDVFSEENLRQFRDK